MSTLTPLFDPLDAGLVRLQRTLTAGQRLQAMLDARELLVGLKRARLRRQYPDLLWRELNLKVLEEISRAQDIRPRP